MTASPQDDPRTVDVVIVGAGPAGVAAAITMKRSGVDVVVVDRATFPRDKICGDGLTALALRELDALGLDPSSVPSWVDVDEVIVRSPSGRTITLPMPDDGLFAAVARRQDLDLALVELARREDVELLEGTTVGHVEQDDQWVTVHTDAVTLRAQYCIGADGMWSPTRKALGVAEPGYRGEWHAFRQYFTDVSDRAANELIVWFEPDLLPGYAWSFPVAGGAANVGFGILRDDSTYRVADMGHVWAELLRRPHIREFLGSDASAEGPHRAWPIPARIEHATLSTGRTLFVGDAATATDPMTGEGIGQALATGRWAAESIIAEWVSPEAVARHYERTVHRHLALDHRFAGLLSKILGSRLGARGAVRIAGSTPWVRRNFGRWLFEDYPRAVLFTPWRWHRGMLKGPGAYRERHANATH